MFKEERLKKIISLVEAKDVVLIQSLVEEVGASVATIHRDINELADGGYIEKIWGGVRSCRKEMSHEPSYDAKGRMNAEEKKRIGQRAYEMIESGSNILLDSGSTCLELAKKLTCRTDLRIVTNDLRIALEFATNKNNNSVVLAGGFLRSDYFSFYGSFCEEILKQIHVPRVFMGADAIDFEHGIMSYTPDDIRVKQIMISNADEIVLLCDHTKFDVAAYLKIDSLANVDRIITGRELDDDRFNIISEKGIVIERV